MEQREIFRRNEADANRYAAMCMRVAAVVAGLMWLLNLLGFFIVDPVLMNVAMPVGIVLFLLPTVLLRVWRGWVWLLKYVSMGCFLLGVGILAGALTIQLVLAWACPISSPATITPHGSPDSPCWGSSSACCWRCTWGCCWGCGTPI